MSASNQLKNHIQSKGFYVAIIHAFSYSSLVYCNSLLTALPKKMIKQLQVLAKRKWSEHLHQS